MIKVVATFLFKPEDVDKAIAIAEELVTETRKEKGCAQYELARSNDTAGELVVLESWETQEDLDVHSASAHFTRIVPALAGMAVQPPAVKAYTPVL